MSEQDDPARLRAAVLGWLTSHDPQTLTQLERHPYRETILDRATDALIRSLQEGREVLADPAAVQTLEPAERDQVAFYLLPHPQGLEAALVENLAGDRDYWQLHMRWASMLTDQTLDEEEPTAPSSPPTT